MWDGTPPQPPPGTRKNKGLLGRYGDAPAASSARRPAPDTSTARARQPYTGTSARIPAAGPTGTRIPVAGMTGRVEAMPQRHGFAIFHDGNAGHLWRGEFASLLGETVLAVGAILWLIALTGSLKAITLAVLVTGMPWLLAGPLATRLRNVAEPGGPLKWIGRLRFVLALGLIAMHYHTILPVVYLLLFAIALCGRLRSALRAAATRTCLAPGDLEHVANDVHIGATVAAILGPLLATLLFVLIGERILLISIGSALLFLLSANSDGFLDALPPGRRAFLLAAPEADDEDDEDDDPELRREELLPEWYQQGPETAGQGVREIRDGLALGAAGPHGGTALRALGLLALVGGGLSVLEVFYVTQGMLLPAFYLGVLLAAEAGGLALGALLADLFGASGRLAVVFGMALSGGGVAGLALLPRLPQALGAAVALGMGIALAAGGARWVLLAPHTGAERRAIAAGEGTLVACCTLLGAALFALFFGGVAHIRPLARLGRVFPGWPIGELFLGIGAGLVLAAVLFGVQLAIKPRARRVPVRRGRDSQRDEDGYEDGYEEDGWDDENASGAWDSQGYDEGYGARDTGGYTAPRRTPSSSRYGPATGYGPDTGYGRGMDTGEYDEYDDDPGGYTGYRPRGGGRPRR